MHKLQYSSAGSNLLVLRVYLTLVLWTFALVAWNDYDDEDADETV